ncbi:MAG: phosphatidylinositol-specific phospholipase C/glycerophosphodiester phosphodiesterase family protein [Chitinophagaceae bacterium]
MNVKIPYFFLLSLCYFIFATNSDAQPIVYTAANAHSHNDYEQSIPFALACQEGFGSIEADIHLVDGLLLVGHDSKDLKKDRTLEHLYLKPINLLGDSVRKLQLMIDIKTDAVATIQALIDLLKQYPKIIQSDYVSIVISGNRPEPALYSSYPDFILFDGRLEQRYTTDALKKIAMLSEDFSKFTDNKSEKPNSEKVKNRIRNAIKMAHEWNKPVRFWGNPDYPKGWEELMNLGVDYINTDHIQQLAEYLKKRK